MIPRTDSRTLSPGFSDGGFSRTDLVMMLGAAGLLMAVVLPALSMQRFRAEQVGCVANLHRLGQAFHAWSEDHDNTLPFMVSRREGGSSGSISVAYYAAMTSNFLASPRILTCPASMRSPASAFSTLRDANVSYSLGTHAHLEKPRSILAADFDMEGGGMEICILAGRIVVTGFPGIAGKPATFSASWSGTNHVYSGNILLVEGAVGSGDSALLRSVLSQSPVEAEQDSHFLVPR